MQKSIQRGNMHYLLCLHISQSSAHKPGGLHLNSHPTIFWLGWLYFWYWDAWAICIFWRIITLSVKESESEVAQSCPTLCDPMDCNLPGSSIHGIFQARTLEWVAISFSRRSSQPKDWTLVSCIVGRSFTIWATREVLPILGRGYCSKRELATNSFTLFSSAQNSLC